MKLNKCNKNVLLKHKEISKEKIPPPPTFLCFTKVKNKCRYHAVLILTSVIFPVSRKSTHVVDR